MQKAAKFGGRGRFQQSAAESSFDTWIDAGGERARNASVNIYSKGMLLATAIDIEIRRQTKGNKGFEHVHQYLYQHHTVDKGGYSEANVRTALKSVTGNDWSAWWAKYVDSTGDIPFAELLNHIGMRYLVEGGKEDEQKEEWFTGWRTRDTGDHPVVIEVERDSPAWKAGVVAGDILVAANGLRLTPKDINDKLWLAQQLPIKLSVFRRDELREISLTPARQIKGKAKLKAADTVNDEQKALNASWLGVAWPVAKSSSPNPEKTKD